MESTIASLPLAAPPQRERNALVARLQSSEIFLTYQRAFQAITGLPLIIRAAGSLQAGLSHVKNGNALCALMATRNKTCGACLQVQGRLETACDKDSTTLECFAGLNESAVAIRVGEQVVAYLYTGQVLFLPPTAAHARRIAGELDLQSDVALAESAYLQSRVVARPQYESSLRLLEIFARQLST